MEGTINHETLCAELFVVCMTGILLFFAFSKTQKATTSKQTENVQTIKKKIKMNQLC
jgi:hypothetical protein